MANLEQSGAASRLPEQILLQSERLYLRRFCQEDAPLLFALHSDPEVMRFISKGQPTSLERIENEILPTALAGYAQSPPQGIWAAHLRSSNEFIGWFHLRPDKLAPEEMELGYRLARSVWGMGLATEGSRALLERSFTDWNYPKVCARTLAINLASRRVMEKIGLRFECDFIYGEDILAGWPEEERRAVKYALARD